MSDKPYRIGDVFKERRSNIPGLLRTPEQMAAAMKAIDRGILEGRKKVKRGS